VSSSSNFLYHRYEKLIELEIIPVICTLWACTSIDLTLIKTALVVSVFTFSSGAIICSGAPSLRIRGASKFVFLTSCICALCIHIPFALQEANQYWGMPPEQVTRVFGKAVDDSRPHKGGGSKITLSLNRAEDRFGTLVESQGQLTIFSSDSIKIYQGQKLSVPVHLFQSSSTSDDTKKNDYHFGTSYRPPGVVGFSSPLLQARAEVLSKMKAKLKSIGSESPPLLEALLLGYKNENSHRLCTLFRRAGCAHLLALSGMHLGVLSLGVLVCFVPLFGRRGAVVLSLSILVFYLFLVGVRPSMLRAVIMYAVGSMGFLFIGAKPDPFHLLCVTFVIQSLVSPQDAYSLGFQLSYIALMGICLWTRAVARCIPALIPPLARDAFAATSAAQCCSAFILVKSFGVLYPGGLLAPLVLTPLVTLWMWGGLGYMAWSALLSRISAPLFVMGDRLFRLYLEQSALYTVVAVRWWGRFRPIEVSPEKWPTTALISASVLTLFSLCQYAGRYGRRIKLQLSQIDSPVSSGEWDGANPPVWTELSHFPGDTRENNRAA